MRLFQNAGLYPSYRPRLNALSGNATGFEERRRVFLDDRFGALHILKPVLDNDPRTFFTTGDNEILQRQWARENGLNPNLSLENILLAQIEHHQTEVLYNLDPIRYPSAFVRKLPGSVRKSICWRGVPSHADLTAYDAVLANFPSVLESWRRKGCRAEWFAPAIDPIMDQYGDGERPIDVLFVGGYSRYHSSAHKCFRKWLVCLPLGRWCFVWMRRASRGLRKVHWVGCCRCESIAVHPMLQASLVLQSSVGSFTN